MPASHRLFREHRPFPGDSHRFHQNCIHARHRQRKGTTTMLLKVTDVQARLNVSQSTVYALIESGKLHCHRIGRGRGAVRVSEEDLQAFLANCRSEQQREAPRCATPRVKLKHLRL